MLVLDTSNSTFPRHVLGLEYTTPISWGPTGALGWSQPMRRPQTGRRGRYRHSIDRYNALARYNVREERRGCGNPEEAEGGQGRLSGGGKHLHGP